MKKTIVLLSAVLFSLAVSAENGFNFIRIGETNPSTSAYVFGTGEQISGQQFQTDGILTYKGYQYTVYYNQAKYVCIARRKLPLGVWDEVALPYRYGDLNLLNGVQQATRGDDAHNVIVMGICPNDGTIHLAYDHHNLDLHYCRSVLNLANDTENIPWEAASFGATTDVLDKAVPNVTYPRFITKPDGNLLFECRFNWSGHGDSYLREYDGNTQTWTRIGCYVQGEDVNAGNPLKDGNNNILYAVDACAYINGMTYDKSGNLHVTWCWRDDYGGGSNHDFYYAYSDDHGRTWKNDKGVKVADTQNIDPVLNSTSIGCLSQHMRNDIMVEEIAYNRGYINQETQAVDSKGRIFAVNSHIPDGEGTDSDWNRSRTKARLHLRFLKEDGTWVKRLITYDGGNSINSTRRVHLAFDSFDNAYVVATGAGVFMGSPDDEYTNWTRLTEDIKTGYYSEPLVDRVLLKENGVLSFVNLSADNKIVVIDYLLDNPNIPAGAGLTAQYFSDENFTTLINSEKNVLPSAVSLPANTKSVRWTGTFETSYAENYALYINTSAATTVYVDGVKVLLTRKADTARDYEFTFAPIASHKHNIVIESQAAGTDAFSLSWSTPGMAKTVIPVTALYAEPANDIPGQDEGDEPELKRKAELADMLIGLQTITEKGTISAASFNPQGDYSVEVNAKIISSVGCGLILEGRAATGKGFRIALDETKLSWQAPYAQSTLLTVADNSEEQAYRLAVNNETVHIYLGEEYIASVALTEIGDIDGSGNEVMPTPQSTDLNLFWAGSNNNNGTGTPADYGWKNTAGSINWAAANSGGNVRFEDVTSGHTYNGAAYTGRLMTIRWDGGQGTYSFPVTLEANTAYEFSMLYEWWSNTSGAISVGVSRASAGTDLLAVKSMAVAGRNILQKGVLAFTSKEAGTYYLTFNGQSGAMNGIGNLELKKNSYQPKLTLSKYCEDTANIQLTNVMYENGAYAPGNEKPDEELEEKETLPREVAANIQIAGLNGSKNIRKFSFDQSGDYSVEIAAAIQSSQGRGMDMEVRDEQGLGFRTALNNTEFSLVAPFAQPQVVGASTTDEQIIRYAVKDNKVYVFRDGEFVTSFSKQTVGDMDEAGTAEKMPYSNTAVNDAANKIADPDFKNTADNGAPEGWVSNGSLGISGGARVQYKGSTDQLSAYPDGSAAFLIRFDQSYTWFSYPVVLKAGTWYEYAFDLIAWGGNNANKTLGLTITTGQGNTGTEILTQQLTTPATAATTAQQVIRFKTDAAGTYYINLIKSGTLAGTAGITNLCLVEYPINGILVGKNYTQGTAAINIRYISVDTSGAFAPLKKATSSEPEEEPGVEILIWSENNRLVIEGLQPNMEAVCIYDVSGRSIINKEISGPAFSAGLPSGIYLVVVVTADQQRIIKKVVVN